MDLRKKAACFFFMERKKAPDAPCAGQRDSPDDSPHRRVDFSANGRGIAPSPIAHGAPPDMPRSAVYGQRRPPCRSEAGNMCIVISAPEQSCSSRRFQAEAHSPRSGLRIAGKAGVRTESGSVGALLMHGQRRPEAKVTRIVSAPKQSCSSRHYSSRSTLPRSALRIAGKAGVRTESGSVGALLMKKQFRNPCPAKAPMRAAF